MQDKREALRLELRGIIKTDHEAAQLLAEAQASVRDIEAFTQKQKDEILAEANKRREAADMQAAAEAGAKAERQKADAKHQFESAKHRLATEMAQNRDAWVEEIVAGILGEAKG